MAEVQPILIDLPEELVGERVIVRPWAEADSDDLWDAIDNSREHLEAWMPWVDRYHNPDDALEYTRRSRARWLLREDLSMAIVEKSTGQVVGGSGMHRPDWKFRLFEIGYWIRQDRQGRGYVSETVQLLTRLAFDQLDANRVELRIDTRNIRSLRVAERLGFVLEGTLRRKLPAPDGTPADMHVLALLPEEYRLLPWATE
ncbi:MAG TPA: GNAT family N-acetyltransferase [Chloroflexota bacterium]|nr:GNAT family N-acetyltransferase [Chloroflexota bacterium]